MSDKGSVVVVMAVEKETPGTFRFKEVVAEGDKPLVGTLYVPKDTLTKMGFESEDQIVVTVRVNA